MTDERALNLVIAGHVDHGKSTLTARLLRDTGSLPQGKIEALKDACARQGRTFELAFVLDALKEEQKQNVTIEGTRVFFRGKDRPYLLVDAPGHVEFLRNMVSGASRADAALLVIDAAEGVQENSRRHASLLAFLGLRQIGVVINKMDRVGFSQAVFENVRDEFQKFAAELGLAVKNYVPASAADGDHVVTSSAKLSWFNGPTVFGLLESFKVPAERTAEPLRFQIQDVYRLSRAGVEARALAGLCVSGSLRAGQDLLFQPSGVRSRIGSLENYPGPSPSQIGAGETGAFTLTDRGFVSRGDCAVDPATPLTQGRLWRARILWLGTEPLRESGTYTLKTGPLRVPVRVNAVLTRRNAATLETLSKSSQVHRNEIATLEFQAESDLVADLSTAYEDGRRFVLLDRFEICGAGFFEERLQKALEEPWSQIPVADRAKKQGHPAALVLMSSGADSVSRARAQAVEKLLFAEGLQAAAVSPGEDVVARALLHHGFVVLWPCAKLSAQDIETWQRGFAGPCLTVDVTAEDDVSVAKRIKAWCRSPRQP